MRNNITISLSHHQTNEVFAKTALMCLSTLTLRSKENSQALLDVGAAETIVECMKLHTNSKIVQVSFSKLCSFNCSFFH